MKVALLILGCLLFVQISHPLTTFHPSSLSSQKQTARATFREDTFLIFYDLCLYILNGMSQIFGNVVEKAKFEENPSEELTRHLANFTQFISDVKLMSSADKNLFNMMSISHLLKQMGQMIHSYEAAATDYPELIPTNLTLSENGFGEFKSKFLAKKTEVETRLFNAIEAYVSSGLTPEEAKREEKLINWYNSYKNNTDMGIKSELFSNYEQLFV